MVGWYLSIAAHFEGKSLLCNYVTLSLVNFKSFSVNIYTYFFDRFFDSRKCFFFVSVNEMELLFS